MDLDLTKVSDSLGDEDPNNIYLVGEKDSTAGSWDNWLDGDNGYGYETSWQREGK